MCVYYEDEPKEPMHKILDTFRLMQKDTLTTKYPLLVKTVEERVNASLQRLTEEISRVQARIKLRNDARLSYDHYTVKLAGLKKERDKVISQGKLASWKNRDRYERNGRKFEDSKKNYEFLNSAVTDEIQALLDDRFLHINAFCTACVKMQRKLTFSHNLTRPFVPFHRPWSYLLTMFVQFHRSILFFGVWKAVCVHYSSNETSASE